MYSLICKRLDISIYKTFYLIAKTIRLNVITGDFDPHMNFYGKTHYYLHRKKTKNDRDLIFVLNTSY